MRSKPRHARLGFTLVEMLVVITIIGILVALLIPTIAGVMRRTRNAAIAVELQDLTKAVEAYKGFANDYPPDFTNLSAVTAHVSRGFSRNTRNVATWWSSQDTTVTPNRAYANLDPAESLVFWLSLVSTNPRDPLVGAQGAFTGERKTFYTFDTARLKDADGDGWMEYYPKYASDAPYVYFDGRVSGTSYSYGTAAYPVANASSLISVFGRVRPYRSNTVIDVRDNNRTQPRPVNVTDTADPQYPNRTQWLHPGKFQLICAGLDNHFGSDIVASGILVFKQFPTPNRPYYDAIGSDEDNLASFSEMKTLGESIP